MNFWLIWYVTSIFKLLKCYTSRIPCPSQCPFTANVDLSCLRNRIIYPFTQHPFCKVKKDNHQNVLPGLFPPTVHTNTDILNLNARKATIFTIILATSGPISRLQVDAPIFSYVILIEWKFNVELQRSRRRIQPPPHQYHLRLIGKTVDPIPFSQTSQSYAVLCAQFRDLKLWKTRKSYTT